MPEGLGAIPPRAEGLKSPGWEGTTTLNSGHRHTWTIDEKGQGVTDRVMGHDHLVTLPEGADPNVPQSYVLGAPEGNLVARVPIYGELRFLDREGNPALKGINVGQEWEYRSYIEGRTLASAIWTFHEHFREGLWRRPAAGSEFERVSHLQRRHRDARAGHYYPAEHRSA